MEDLLWNIYEVHCYMEGNHVRFCLHRTGFNLTVCDPRQGFEFSR